MGTQPGLLGGNLHAAVGCVLCEAIIDRPLRLVSTHQPGPARHLVEQLPAHRSAKKCARGRVRPLRDLVQVRPAGAHAHPAQEEVLRRVVHLRGEVLGRGEPVGEREPVPHEPGEHGACGMLDQGGHGPLGRGPGTVGIGVAQCPGKSAQPCGQHLPLRPSGALRLRGWSQEAQSARSRRGRCTAPRQEPGQARSERRYHDVACANAHGNIAGAPCAGHPPVNTRVRAGAVAAR